MSEMPFKTNLGKQVRATGTATADKIDHLCRTLKLPGRLRDVGVPQEGLKLITAATLHDRGLATNPRPVNDAGPMMVVLRNAW